MSQAQIALNPSVGLQPAEPPAPSLFKFFFSPTAFFQSLDVRTVWVKAFLICSGLTVATILISLPLISHASAAQLGQLPVDRQQELLSTMRASQYVAILFSPVMQLLKLVIGAYVLWGLTVLSGADIQYRKLLSLLSYASIVPILDRLWGYSLNYLAGVDKIETGADIRSTLLSLSAFFDFSSHPALRSLVDNCDLMSFWYFVVLVSGLAILGKMSRMKSTVIVFAFFFAQLAFAVGTNLLFVKGS